PSRCWKPMRPVGGTETPMAERYFNRPLLDLTSHARRGPTQRLSPAEIQQIRRTVGRSPEVMVKVLSQSASTVSHVRRHVDYVSRNGEFDLETDDGQNLSGADLVADWDLEVPTAGSAEKVARGDDRAPRLVHKLVFSMPSGTSPTAVLKAVGAFTREEFALKHRYAMALHTDEPHPHVHVIVKAVSERGVRLNIRKETLRRWRAAFATQLRAQGVDANATERTARGSPHQNRKFGIYRADQRGESTFMLQRALAFDRDPEGARAADRAARARLMRSREQVERGWLTLADAAGQEGLQDVASQIRRFVERLPTVRTDRETTADRSREKYFLEQARGR
ncbi:MAG: relaxase/mobilization nuclease domain-containing protein, partial [Steroidobacteraceae bacterium]